MFKAKEKVSPEEYLNRLTNLARSQSDYFQKLNRREVNEKLARSSSTGHLNKPNGKHAKTKLAITASTSENNLSKSQSDSVELDSASSIWNASEIETPATPFPESQIMSWTGIVVEHPSQRQAEYIHHMIRMASYFDSYARKHYNSGWLFKKNDLMPDGMTFQNREWTLYLVTLQGADLQFWKAPDGMHLMAASFAPTGGIVQEENNHFIPSVNTIEQTLAVKEMEKMMTKNDPSILNIFDAHAEWIGLFHRSKKSYSDKTGVLALNTAGSNRFFLQTIPYHPNTMLPSALNSEFAPVSDDTNEPAALALSRWINAIRLSCFESRVINQAFTELLIRYRQDLNHVCRHTLRIEKLLQRQRIVTKQDVIHQDLSYQGWLQIRFTSTTEWRRLWCVLKRSLDIPATSTSSPSFLRKSQSSKSATSHLNSNRSMATMTFYENELDAEHGTLQHAVFEITNLEDAYVQYPEKPKLADISSIFKLEGGHVTLGGKATRNLFPSTVMDKKIMDRIMRSDVYEHVPVQVSSFASNVILCMAFSQLEMAQWLATIWSIFGIDPYINVLLCPHDAPLPSDCRAQILDELDSEHNPLLLKTEDVAVADARNVQYKNPYWDTVRKKQERTRTLMQQRPLQTVESIQPTTYQTDEQFRAITEESARLPSPPPPPPPPRVPLPQRAKKQQLDDDSGSFNSQKALSNESHPSASSSKTFNVKPRPSRTSGERSDYGDKQFGNMKINDVMGSLKRKLENLKGPEQEMSQDEAGPVVNDFNKVPKSRMDLFKPVIRPKSVVGTLRKKTLERLQGSSKDEEPKRVSSTPPHSALSGVHSLASKLQDDDQAKRKTLLNEPDFDDVVANNLNGTPGHIDVPKSTVVVHGASAGPIDPINLSPSDGALRKRRTLDDVFLLGALPSRETPSSSPSIHEQQKITRERNMSVQSVDGNALLETVFDTDLPPVAAPTQEPALLPQLLKQSKSSLDRVQSPASFKVKGIGNENNSFKKPDLSKANLEALLSAKRDIKPPPLPPKPSFKPLSNSESKNVLEGEGIGVEPVGAVVAPIPIAETGGYVRQNLPKKPENSDVESAYRLYLDHGRQLETPREEPPERVVLRHVDPVKRQKNTGDDANSIPINLRHVEMPNDRKKESDAFEDLVDKMMESTLDDNVSGAAPPPPPPPPPLPPLLESILKEKLEKRSVSSSGTPEMGRKPNLALSLGDYDNGPLDVHTDMLQEQMKRLKHVKPTRTLATETPENIVGATLNHVPTPTKELASRQSEQESSGTRSSASRNSDKDGPIKKTNFGLAKNINNGQGKLTKAPSEKSNSSFAFKPNSQAQMNNSQFETPNLKPLQLHKRNTFTETPENFIVGPLNHVEPKKESTEDRSKPNSIYKLNNLSQTGDSIRLSGSSKAKTDSNTSREKEAPTKPRVQFSDDHSSPDRISIGTYSESVPHSEQISPRNASNKLLQFNSILSAHLITPQGNSDESVQDLSSQQLLYETLTSIALRKPGLKYSGRKQLALEQFYKLVDTMTSAPVHNILEEDEEQEEPKVKEEPKKPVKQRPKKEPSHPHETPWSETLRQKMLKRRRQIEMGEKIDIDAELARQKNAAELERLEMLHPDNWTDEIVDKILALLNHSDRARTIIQEEKQIKQEEKIIEAAAFDDSTVQSSREKHSQYNQGPTPHNPVKLTHGSFAPIVPSYALPRHFNKPMNADGEPAQKFARKQSSNETKPPLNRNRRSIMSNSKPPTPKSMSATSSSSSSQYGSLDRQRRSLERRKRVLAAQQDQLLRDQQTLQEQTRVLSIYDAEQGVVFQQPVVLVPVQTVPNASQAPLINAVAANQEASHNVSYDPNTKNFVPGKMPKPNLRQSFYERLQAALSSPNKYSAASSSFSSTQPSSK